MQAPTKYGHLHIVGNTAVAIKQNTQLKDVRYEECKIALTLATLKILTLIRCRYVH